jgi:hypothetical protein
VSDERKGAVVVLLVQALFLVPAAAVMISHWGLGLGLVGSLVIALLFDIRAAIRKTDAVQ